MGLSDAKVVDAQCGFEAGIGLVLAALAGVNMVSSAGMLDFESCFSLEKLVIDAEIIAQARRLTAGIVAREPSLAVDLLQEVGHAGNFLAHPHTGRWFREELSLPGPVVDRDFRRQWETKGAQDAWARAHMQAEALIAGWTPHDLPSGAAAELELIALAAARQAGAEALPER
jgi:trimethylamine--corrinoid protein Co-methyltransferase